MDRWDFHVNMLYSAKNILLKIGEITQLQEPPPLLVQPQLEPLLQQEQP